jgi:hypothetical protein
MNETSLQEKQMNKSNPLNKLAEQVRQGQAGTEQMFWQQMGPQLERMVRRVVRFGPGHSVLEQKIGREVGQVTANPHNPASLDREKVIGMVTRRLFQEMLDRLQSGSGRPVLETQGHPRPLGTRIERAPALAMN